MVEAVIFDMDGLLVDSEPLWRAAEKKVFATVDIHLTETDFEQFMGFKINEVVDFWYNHKTWTDKSKTDVENEILDELEFLIDTQARAQPGVEQVINFFEGKKVPLAIASSSPSLIIKSVLKKLNIAQYFKVVHSAEMERYGKPHPAVYLTTARQLQVSPVNCLVFEDSFNGLLAAKAARTKTISVPEGDAYNQTRFDIADFKLRSLTDFTEEHWIKLNG
ncbi:MAG: hexitol phosphatase HxpB [Bacteroidia bacterium]|nr:hexitol phosphatase HxpB [Bacteroidia bacterium]